MTAITELEPNIDRSIEMLITRLKTFAGVGPTTINMSAWLQFWAFDALGNINFSQPIGFLESGKDIHGICELDHEMMLYYAVVSRILICDSSVDPLPVPKSVYIELRAPSLHDQTSVFAGLIGTCSGDKCRRSKNLYPNSSGTRH